MDKQFLADTGADVCWRHPQVIQLRFVLPHNQSVETEQVSIAFSDVDLICGDEVRRDGQVVLPVLYPMFRIAPMPFSIMSNARQRGGVFS